MPSTTSSHQRRRVIACGCLEPELESLRPADAGVTVRYLPQSLHRTPELTREALQSAVDEVEPSASEVVLAYGLCSNAVVGLQARAQGLRVPRVHDCIALFLGSREAYRAAFRRRPGSYYLTPGWLAENQDPLGMLKNEYIPRVGREEAEWALRTELSHYTHVVLVVSPACDPKSLRVRAQQNACFLNKTYEEVRGELGYLRRVLFGPYDDGWFVHVEPGQTVPQEPFLE